MNTFCTYLLDISKKTYLYPKWFNVGYSDFQFSHSQLALSKERKSYWKHSGDRGDSGLALDVISTRSRRCRMVVVVYRYYVWLNVLLMEMNGLKGRWCWHQPTWRGLGPMKRSKPSDMIVFERICFVSLFWHIEIVDNGVQGRQSKLFQESRNWQIERVSTRLWIYGATRSSCVWTNEWRISGSFRIHKENSSSCRKIWHMQNKATTGQSNYIS